MKNKLFVLLVLIVMLTAAILGQKKEHPHNRYYQHREPAKQACSEHDKDVFCSHLPIINISTNAPIPDPYHRDSAGHIIDLPNGRHDMNNTMVSAKVQVFDSEQYNNHLTDRPVLEEYAVTRIRGNSSRRFDKKSYLLKFTEENGIDNKKLSLLGMVPDNNWALHGPFLDRTLIRNYICCHIAGEIMDFSPDVRFCELFINDEYMGVYLAMEKINFNKNGRIHLSETDPKLSDTSYLIKLDHGGLNNDRRLNTFFDFSRKRGLMERGIEEMEILYPNDTLTEAQKKRILYELSCFEKAISSYDSDDPKKGYNAYIDVDSFVDYFVVNEFFMNADAGNLSTFFCKDLRGKIQIIGWDYNNTFNCFYEDLSNPHGIYADDTLYNYLLKNKTFVDKVVARYHELRKTTLSDANVLNLIDETTAYLAPAAIRNYQKYGYCFDSNNQNASHQRKLELGIVKPFSRNPQSYEQSIEMLKDTVVAHGSYLDKNIETLYARCHTSTNKQFKQDGGKKR